MSPKFRGGSSRNPRGYVDSWLDNQALSGGKGKSKKKSAPKAELLDPALANATVTEVFPNQCRVKPDSSMDGCAAHGAEAAEILCPYRRAQVIASGGDASARERSPVAVGDRVLAKRMGSQDGVIEGICERRNFLARPAPGRESAGVVHVVAANVDLLVIVASVRDPEFSPGLVDRYLIAAQAAAIPTLICASKTDLLEGAPSIDAAQATEAVPGWELYARLGFACLPVSVRSGEGVGSLKEKISGKTAVFCGHSGVGKTSLFRALIGEKFGEQFGRVGEVNSQTGKGKHTTTSAVLYRDEPTRSNWIDTPGVKAFGLLGVDVESLGDYFPEFRSLGCAAQGCHHLDEPGCLARRQFRHASYLRIRESLLEGNS